VTWLAVLSSAAAHRVSRALPAFVCLCLPLSAFVCLCLQGQCPAVDRTQQSPSRQRSRPCRAPPHPLDHGCSTLPHVGCVPLPRRDSVAEGRWTTPGRGRARERHPEVGQSRSHRRWSRLKTWEQGVRTMALAPESMRFRGLRLTIDGEGRRSHGGPRDLSARITRRFQPGKPDWARTFDLRPIPLPFPGRREIYTWSFGPPARVLAQRLLPHRRVGLDTPVSPGVACPYVVGCA
jgi:hypothetical protein